MKIEYKHSIILTLLLMAQMLLACNDDAKNTEISMVSDSSVKIGYVGGKELIKFICYDKWTISSDVGWIKFESPTEGNGNAIIRISVDKNTSEKERIGQLSITCGSNAEIIKVVQSIKTINIEHRHPSLLYTKEELLNIKSMIEENRSADITRTTTMR